MRLAQLFILLALVILFGPRQLDFNLRISIVVILAASSFYFYLRDKISQWRLGGLNPATVLLGRILGAVLGAGAAMIGGVLARLSLGAAPAAEAMVLAPVEGLAGAIFGVLLGASEGVTAEVKSNVLIGAVCGGFGGSMGGAMGEIRFGTTSVRILGGALGGGAAGLAVGALVGYLWRHAHQILLEAFPGLRRSPRSGSDSDGSLPQDWS